MTYDTYSIAVFLEKWHLFSWFSVKQGLNERKFQPH